MSVEEHLNKIRSSEAATSSSASSASQKLGDLKDLCSCIDNLLEMPLTRQALSHQCCRTGVEDLLDIGGIVRDVFSQVKECSQQLESSFRRRKDSSLVPHELPMSAEPNLKGWSLVSRLLSSKRVSCEGDMDANEVEELDLELLVLRSAKDINV
ncbi:hypothetical protein NL676_025272 [Syzygium grande]|nr:hypothetical protein NL676_025272 [Syzygium grande]